MRETLVAGSIFLLPIVVTAGIAYLVFIRHPATTAEAEHMGLERYDQIIRSVITLSFVSGFLLLAWIGKISPEVFANTSGILLAFWFGSKKNGAPNGASNKGA